MRLSLSRNASKGIKCFPISSELYLRMHSKENGTFTVELSRKEAKKVKEVLAVALSKPRGE